MEIANNNFSYNLDWVPGVLKEPLVAGASIASLFSLAAFVFNLSAYQELSQGTDYLNLETSVVYLKVVSDGLSFIGNGIVASAKILASLKIHEIALSYVKHFTFVGAVGVGLSSIFSYYASFVKENKIGEKIQNELALAVQFGDFEKEKAIVAYQLGSSISQLTNIYTFVLSVVTISEVAFGVVFSTATVTAVVGIGMIFFISGLLVDKLYDLDAIEKKYFPIGGS